MTPQIITIAREYGSGGRLIGRRAAAILGIDFYDAEIIRLAAKESGLDAEFVEEEEESTTSSLLYNLATGAGVIGHGIYSAQNLPLQDRVYIAQQQVIQKIANDGPCVIVGRAANYILRERQDVLNIFIHARKKYRVEEIAARHRISVEEAEKAVQKKDRSRAAHHRHYTDQEWADPHNYHLAIDSGAFGPDDCADIIVSVYRG